MGASRKLQGEIDRVLKKVQEGVDLFDSIWNKVSASYEEALMDARKLIEREMERFKICGKETKTQAFSEEGLGQQPKTVGELESQIDSFEAEMEGLFVKKGKTRPPRLTRLEISVTRHKAHIMKLEFILRLLDNDVILRLLDNDELSPEQVNDVKDFLDDYVERNQDDFEEFSDVDDLYSSLPLEKVESLEDLVTVGPPGLVKAVVTSSNLLGSSVPEQVEETASQDSSLDIIPKTPSSKNSIVGSSAPTTTASHATPGTVNATTHILPAVSTASAILSGPSSARGVLENASAIVSSSPISLSISSKEEEVANFPGRKSSPAVSETGLKGTGRGGLTSPLSTSNLISSGGAISSIGALDAAVSSAERLGSSSMAQPLVSLLSNRMMLPQAAKANDGINLADNGNVGEAAAMAGSFPLL